MKVRLGLVASLTTLWRAARDLGLTVKKVHRSAEPDRPDVARDRTQWRAAVPRLDPDRLVFVDETWDSTAMTRRTGRSPRGRPLVMPVPHGHRKTTTFVAALRTDGMAAPTGR